MQIKYDQEKASRWGREEAIIKRFIQKGEGALEMWSGNGFKELKISNVGFWKGANEFDTKKFILDLKGKFKTPIHKILYHAKLIKAVTKQGEDLVLPKWYNKIILTEDADSRLLGKIRPPNSVTHVTLSMDLAVPGQNPAGLEKLRQHQVKLKELQGTLQYAIVPGTTFRQDLGISEFKLGAQGNKYNVVIERLKKGCEEYVLGYDEFNPMIYEGCQKNINEQNYFEQIELNLDVHYTELVNAYFYDQDGNLLDTERNSGWTFSIKGRFPERGRIELELYDLEYHTMPFVLKDVIISSPNETGTPTHAP